MCTAAAAPAALTAPGFTTYVMKHFGYSISRTASGQMDNGTSISKSELQPGDLVFFNNGNSSKRATHVGIYTGNGQFVHASTSTTGRNHQRPEQQLLQQHLCGAPAVCNGDDSLLIGLKNPAEPRSAGFFTFLTRVKSPGYRFMLRTLTNTSLGRAPTSRWISLPSLKKITVGMLMTP